MNITVKEIVAKYLAEHGYGGLYCHDTGCGCELADLVPCDNPCDQCEAAYRVKADCEHCDSADDCLIAHEGADFCMQTEAPAPTVGPEPNTAQHTQPVTCSRCGCTISEVWDKGTEYEIVRCRRCRHPWPQATGGA